MEIGSILAKVGYKAQNGNKIACVQIFTNTLEVKWYQKIEHIIYFI